MESAEVLVKDTVESHSHVLILAIYLFLGEVEGCDHLSFITNNYVGLADERFRVIVENYTGDELYSLSLELA